MSVLLLVLAILLALAGIYRLFNHDILWGLILIVLALVAYPGGSYLF